MELTHEHTDDCVAVDDEECAPARGGWLQPLGTYVQQAEDELEEGHHWCVLHKRAWELMDADES
jgi:hypothetical protein